jgi:SAM-dependent methyltransferase
VSYIIHQLAEKLERINSVQGKKIQKHLSACDSVFYERSEFFLSRYYNLLSFLQKDWDYALDCYNKLIADMTCYRLEFLRTGEYINKSFKDVQQKVYETPEVMEYHMHGLALAQFFWIDQYERFRFFADNLAKYKPVEYLEIGPGHGLYLLEAVRQLKPDCFFHGVDISPTSILMTQQVVGETAATFSHFDILESDERKKYDFITAGEVIEHLEDPKSFLRKISELLSDDGVLYLTTPVNAPMIDHIYLFREVDEIRNLINSSRFKIINETGMFAENMKSEKAKKYKVPYMFAAFIKKSI